MKTLILMMMMMMNIIYCVSLWRDYCNDNRDKDEDKMPMMIVMLGLEL